MIEIGENIKDYSQLESYDGKTMREAVKNVGNWNKDDYDFTTNNCQDYVDTVRKEYYRIGGN